MARAPWTAFPINLVQQFEISRIAVDGNRVGVSVDETTRLEDIADLAEVLTGKHTDAERVAKGLTPDPLSIPATLRRAAIRIHPLR